MQKKLDVNCTLHDVMFVISVTDTIREMLVKKCAGYAGNVPRKYSTLSEKLYYVT
jgi:hypothetical protein